jgi:hypothetical protein
LRDRTRYVVQRLTAPSIDAWENWRLPWSLFRVHCAVRRLRLVTAYGGWLWRRRRVTVPANSGLLPGVY